MDVERLALVARRALPVDTELSFFYPSTEWEMAQPFDCWCGSVRCLKKIQGRPGWCGVVWCGVVVDSVALRYTHWHTLAYTGAKYMKPEDWEGRPMSKHIREMLIHEGILPPAAN